MTTPTTEADVIVIGSGQGGVPLAKELAQRGRKVYLFERDSLGGTCVNFGCMPSKALLAAAHVAAIGRRAERIGVKVETNVRFGEIMQRIRSDVIGETSSGVEEELQSAGVHIVRQEACFESEHVVVGGDYRIESPLIILNTGKAPLIPPIEGLDSVGFFTYKTVWQMSKLPTRLAIVGGGYVGLELGQAFARLGSQVRIFERAERIVDQEEADVSKLLQGALEADGIQFHLASEVEAAEKHEGGIRLLVGDGNAYATDCLLIASGRKPNVESLNLKAAGILTEEDGSIHVDDRFQTTVEGIYAVGDVAGQPAFSHVSWEDYRRLIAILDGEDRSRADRVVSYAFFTEPQVGRTGLTEEQAKDQGLRARSVTMDFSKVARAFLSGYQEGFLRLVVDAESDRILGATIVGPEAAELIHVVVAHIQADSSWRTLEQSVHIHPTFAEALPNLARLLLNQQAYSND